MPVTETELTQAINDVNALRNNALFAATEAQQDAAIANELAGLLTRVLQQLFGEGEEPPPPPPPPPTGTILIPPEKRWNRFVVEFAPTYDVAGNPVWTDITDFVESMSWRSGRSDELSLYSSGSARITLRNEDGRFDPSNLSGPYYPHLKPKREFRIRSQWTNGEYPLFRGFCRGFPQEARYQDNRAYVDVSLVDAFDVIAQAELSHSLYSMQTFKETPLPSAWFRLDDEENTVDGVWNAIDVMGNSDSRYSPRTAAPKFDDGNINGKGFQPNGVSHIELERSRLITNNNRNSFEFWFNSNTIPPSVDSSYIMGNADLFIGIGLPFFNFTDPGTISIVYHMTRNGLQGQFFYRIFSTTNVCDGNWHYVVLVFNGSSLLLYVDARLESIVYMSAGYQWAWANNSSVFYIARKSSDNNTATSLFEPAIIHNVAFYNDIVEVDSIVRKWEAANGWPRDMSGERINRILDLIDWPTSQREIGVGTVEVAATPALVGSPLKAIQDVVTAEVGELFIGNDGKVVFLDRDFLYWYEKSKTVQFVFGDTYLESYPYSDVVADKDDQFVYNMATVSRRGGVSFTSQDEASKNTYWHKGISKTDVLFSNDLYSRALAQWLVYRYKEPILRVQSLTIEAPADIVDVGINLLTVSCLLELALGSRVMVEREPSNSQPWVVEGTIDSISHNVNFRNRMWKCDLKIAPLPPRTFRLDTDALNSGIPLGL